MSINIKIPGLGGKVKTKVLTTFTRQLATLVDAGLPLLRGMRVLEKQERNPTLKSIIGELALSVEGGSTFSEALAQHPKVFNRLYVNMVKAGELGGVLEVVLNRLSEFQEKAQKIKGKVVAAMFYPVAVLIVAMAIMAVLVIIVIPKFKEVFAGLGEGRPLAGVHPTGVEHQRHGAQQHDHDGDCGCGRGGLVPHVHQDQVWTSCVG
jgi:type IV pilus assembly protein PilC